MIFDIEKSDFAISQESITKLKVAMLSIDRKFNDALELVKEPKNVYEAICRAQVQMQSGKIEQSVKDLITYCKDAQVTNSRLLSFLLKACIDCKLNEEKHLIINYSIDNLDKLSKEVLTLIGLILLEEKEFTQALKVFEKFKDNTDDLKVKAGYLSSLAEKNVKAAAEYFDQIGFDLTDYENDEDLHTLIEQALAPKSVSKKPKKKEDDKATKTEKGAVIFIPKAKQKKKIRYPKNYDPENPGLMPDPERWIPKWQRSKGKKKLKLRGPQGDVKNIGVHTKKEHSTANISASTSK